MRTTHQNSEPLVTRQGCCVHDEFELATQMKTQPKMKEDTIFNKKKYLAFFFFLLKLETSITVDIKVEIAEGGRSSQGG